MKKITLAIPEYNTSQYFKDCIKYAVEDNFVDEIVVNDDKSTDQHLDNLISIIREINLPKIKLFVNSQNTGAFRNKYLAVKNSTNDWVYLLDSDNHPFEESYHIIKNISDDDPSICYSPQNLFCKNDNVSDYENISNYDFGYDLIGIEESKKSLCNGVEWFNWFVNTGNYIVNRNTYLETLKEPFEDFSTPLLHADTASVFYYWLKNGNKFKIVQGLRHNHRLRPDSNWHSCGDNSNISVNYYETAIKNL